ncbi:hypothetical protein B7453_13710 [Pseudomonas sp. IB20]|nr:hypothetical protein B7453_13710 [Pseudomonas sp. IB20]
MCCFWQSRCSGIGTASQTTSKPSTKFQCGSWLACDPGTSVFQPDRGDSIAGKPAPTLDCTEL